MSEDKSERKIAKSMSKNLVQDGSLPHRLRRLQRVWPDAEGNISYLLTLCVKGRSPELDNELTFERFTKFLEASPVLYRWFGRRFVIMPDHIHLIARMGHEAVRLGEWIKALKAVVGRGLGFHEITGGAQVRSDGHQKLGNAHQGSGDGGKNFIRRKWQWQKGFHDHKFRTIESERKKWEYVCLNPVRAGLVKCPEDWPYGGEMFYDGVQVPMLVRGTPPLFKTGKLIEKKDGNASE